MCLVLQCRSEPLLHGHSLRSRLGFVSNVYVPTLLPRWRETRAQCVPPVMIHLHMHVLTCHSQLPWQALETVSHPKISISKPPASALKPHFNRELPQRNITISTRGILHVKVRSVALAVVQTASLSLAKRRGMSQVVGFEEDLKLHNPKGSWYLMRRHGSPQRSTYIVECRVCTLRAMIWDP